MAFLAPASLPVEARGSSSVTVEGEGSLSGGYDSNTCILRTTYPSLHHEPCEPEGSGFLGLTGGLSLEVRATPWFGVELEPRFEYLGYFEAGPIMSPTARLGIFFEPLTFFRIDMGATYRWFSFEAFPEAEYHEPGPYLLLGFMTDRHLFQVGATWRKRFYTEIDETEWETRLTLLWSWEAADYFSLKTAAGWARQKSYSEYDDLDEFIFSLTPRLSIKWFYLEPSYTPGILKYAIEEQANFAHRVVVKAGVVPLPLLDISLFYGYEQLFAERERRHGGYDPSYVRHSGGLSIAVSWTVTHPPMVSAPSDDGIPAACTGSRCLFRVKPGRPGPVYLAGSFNGWEERKTPLEGPDAEGSWQVTLTLPSGRHTYMFIVDGKPLVPENAEAYSEDEFGKRSAVVTVP